MAIFVSPPQPPLYKKSDFFRVVKEQRSSVHSTVMLGPTNVAKILKGIFDNIPFEDFDESRFRRLLGRGFIGSMVFQEPGDDKKKRSRDDSDPDDVPPSKSRGVVETEAKQDTSHHEEVKGGGGMVSPAFKAEPRQSRGTTDKGFCGFFLAGHLECKKKNTPVTCLHRGTDPCPRGPHPDFKKELTRAQVLTYLENESDTIAGNGYLGVQFYDTLVSDAGSAPKWKFK